MLKSFYYILIFSLFIGTSCMQKLPYEGALVNPDSVLNDETSFVNYWYAVMDLSFRN